MSYQSHCTGEWRKEEKSEEKKRTYGFNWFLQYYFWQESTCTEESAHSSDTGVGSVETTFPFYLLHEACVTQTTPGETRPYMSLQQKIEYFEKTKTRGEIELD